MQHKSFQNRFYIECDIYVTFDVHNIFRVVYIRVYIYQIEVYKVEENSEICKA